MGSYFHVLKNYFQLSGRSSRKEFWIFYLVNFLIMLILTLASVFSLGSGLDVSAAKESFDVKDFPMLSIIFMGVAAFYSIFTIIPYITVSIRRLHDINKSGLWFFIHFIPFGSFVLLVMHCFKGTDGVNRFDKTVPDEEDEELFTFEDENNEEVSEDKKEEILEDVKELSEKDPVAAGRPQNLIIGYIEEITKKGLKEYIIGQTYKYFPSPHYTVYRIEKYNKGFVYEIHDGGKKLTHLKRVKEEFDSGENEIILKTAGNYVKVAKSGHKLDCMILQDSDLEYGDEDAKIIDTFDMAKMEEAVPLGAGTFLSGLMFLSFGIISLFFAVLFKYGLFNQEEDPVEKITELSEMPHEYFEKLPPPTQYSYIEKMYLEGNQWKQVRKELERPEPSMDMDETMIQEEQFEDPGMSMEEDPYRYDGSAPVEEINTNEEYPQENMDYPEVQDDPFGDPTREDIIEQPMNENGDPVNIFEVDENKVINEDMVEKEIVNDVDSDVLTSSPN